MARYEHLPIYGKAMELAVYTQGLVRNFSRYNKYSLGDELRGLNRHILRLVIRVNSRREKTETLEELVETCEMLKSTLVLCKEAEAFPNFNAFRHCAGLAESLCKQSEGWLKSSRKGQDHQAALSERR